MPSTTRRVLDSINRSDHVVIHTNVQLWSVHIVEAIELALRARAQNAEVTLIDCVGSLSSCPANAMHESSLCGKCNSITASLHEFLEAHEIQTISIPDFSSNQYRLESLENVSSIRELKAVQSGGAPIGRLVASQIANDHKDAYFPIEGPTAARVLAHCDNASALVRWATKLLQEQNATKVFVWNGRRPSDGPVFYAARALGLPSYTYISGGRPGTIFVTSGASVQEVPPAEVAADIEELKAKHVDPLDEGRAHLESYRSGVFHTIGFQHHGPPVQDSLDTKPLTGGPKVWARDKRTRVLLPTSSPREEIHIAEFDELFGDDPYGWIDYLQHQLSSSQFSLLVRWHPRQQHSGPGELRRIQEIVDGAPSNAVHVLPDDDTDTYLLASEADVVVATGSTVALWAAANNKPVIHFDARAHFLDTAWTRVGAEHDLLPTILGAKPANPNSALLWQLYLAERGERMRHILWNGKKPVLPYASTSPVSLFQTMTRRIKNFLREFFRPTHN